MLAVSIENVCYLILCSIVFCGVAKSTINGNIVIIGMVVRNHTAPQSGAHDKPQSQMLLVVNEHKHKGVFDCTI